MSTHAHKDTLQSYRRPTSAFGPTRTKTAQRTFAQRLRGVLGRIDAAIRRGIIEQDIFNLREDTDTLEVEDPPVFETDETPKQQARFIAWLREQLETEFLTIVGPDRNQWIRKAYAEGIRNVHRQLNELDVAFERPDVDELLGAPIHRKALQELYTRCYGNLESVANDVVDDVRDELLRGFREGEGPRTIARSLNERVNSIGKNRSTMIARSEVMNAHSSGTLNRVDEINEDSTDEITVSHGVWDSANDSRTCSLCLALDGTPMDTDEMRNNQVQVTGSIADDESFVGGTFRLKPPAHPNGRCNIRVTVGPSGVDGELDDRLPDEIQVN